MSKGNVKEILKSINLDMGLWLTEDFSRGGMTLLPNGLALFNRLKNLMRPLLGYEVQTPPVYRRELWSKTGHLDYFRDSMFLSGEVGFKPMSCPAHCLILKKIKPNKLPFTLGEFGLVYRKEAYGAVNVPFRNLSFVQDDSHVFLGYKDLVLEITFFVRYVLVIYHALSFNNVKVSLELSPTKSEQMDKVNKLMILLYHKFFGEYSESYDGAFYGPKLEMHLLDDSGRSWQCGTIQLDMQLSKKMNLVVAGKYPLMLHRAALGSLERFIGLLLLQTKGYLPRTLHFDKIHLYLMKDEAELPSFISTISFVKVFKGIEEVRLGWDLAKKHRVPVRIFQGNDEGEFFKVQFHDKDGVKVELMSEAGLKQFLGRLA